MDGNVKDFETREYLRLCQKQWRWILDNYDRLAEEGPINDWDLKGAYFNEYGLDEPESRCYLCELAGTNCPECPLSGIAWREGHGYPCVNDPGSVYWRIKYLMNHGRYREAKGAIRWFLSMIDNECLRW